MNQICLDTGRLLTQVAPNKGALCPRLHGNLLHSMMKIWKSMDAFNGS
jgi:hypothetical protein